MSPVTLRIVARLVMPAVTGTWLLVAEMSATEAEAASNAALISSHQRAIVDAERRKAEAVRNTAALCRQVQAVAC